MPSLVPPRPAHPPPANWPADVFYLTAPFYSPHLPADVAALIRSPNPPPIHKPSTKVEIRLIDNKEHPAHGQRGLFAKKKLAKGELIIWYTGAVHLDPEPLPSQAAIRAASDYDLTLVSQLSTLLPVPTPSAPTAADWTVLGLAVDASQMGNEARMINDFRGTPPLASARPTLDKKGRKVPAKAKPNAFFHSVRTTTLEPARVLEPERSTPAERLQAGAGELRMGVYVGADEGIEKGQEILISYGKSFWRSRAMFD